MRNTIIATLVAILGGLVVLTVEYRYFNSKSPSPTTDSPASSETASRKNAPSNLIKEAEAKAPEGLNSKSLDPTGFG